MCDNALTESYVENFALDIRKQQKKEDENDIIGVQLY